MIHLENELAIYVHWPFCKSKCPYCNFASVVSGNSLLHKKTEECLLIDLKNSLSNIEKRCVKSVFFGGGTPSLMNPKSVDKILNFLFRNYNTATDIEISLEANPATFDENKIKSFLVAGINRLSLGVQSFSGKNLKFLGRIYGEQEAYAAAAIVSKNFSNFSFDFMYGYHSQTEVNLKKDLLQAIDFGCKHISCYQLTFENGTPFHKRLLSKEITEFSEKKFIKQYELIESILEMHNIRRYEISNYAVKGFESKHNLSYWKYDDYLGIGPGAHSRITENGRKNEIIKIDDPINWRRSLNKNSIAVYQKKALTETENLEETIIMGLRLVDGLKFQDLYRKISKETIDKNITYAKLQFLRKQKLIEDNVEKIKLTKTGLAKVNSIAEFLLANA